jgi:hypothetical protein
MYIIWRKAKFNNLCPFTEPPKSFFTGHILLSFYAIPANKYGTVCTGTAYQFTVQ